MKDIKKVFLLVLVAMFSATTYAQTLEDDLKIQIPDKYYKTAKNHRDAILDAVSYEWNGAIQYLNFSDLPTVGDTESKYIVTDDDYLNGYYTWNGLSYDKVKPLNYDNKLDGYFNVINSSDDQTLKINNIKKAIVSIYMYGDTIADTEYSITVFTNNSTQRRIRIFGQKNEVNLEVCNLTVSQPSASTNIETVTIPEFNSSGIKALILIDWSQLQDVDYTGLYPNVWNLSNVAFSESNFNYSIDNGTRLDIYDGENLNNRVSANEVDISFNSNSAYSLGYNVNKDIIGNYNFKGFLDTNSAFPSNPSVGDLYQCSESGTILTIDVEVGDYIVRSSVPNWQKLDASSILDVYKNSNQNNWFTLTTPTQADIEKIEVIDKAIVSLLLRGTIEVDAVYSIVVFVNSSTERVIRIFKRQNDTNTEICRYSESQSTPRIEKETIIVPSYNGSDNSAKVLIDWSLAQDVTYTSLYYDSWEITYVGMSEYYYKSDIENRELIDQLGQDSKKTENLINGVSDFSLINWTNVNDTLQSQSASWSNFAYYDADLNEDLFSSSVKLKAINTGDFEMGIGRRASIAGTAVTLKKDGTGSYIVYYNMTSTSSPTQKDIDILSTPLENDKEYVLKITKLVPNITQLKVELIYPDGEIYEITKSATTLGTSMWGYPAIFCNTGQCEAYDFSFNMPYARNRDPKLLIFGDSFIEGNSIPAQKDERYAALLTDDLGSDECVLLGKGGESTTSVLGRFYEQVDWFEDAKYCLIALGTNDYVFETYQSNINAMISYLEDKNITPILVTVTSRDDNDNTAFQSDANSWIRSSDYLYIDFSLAVTEVGDERTWRSGFRLSDQVHPSTTGHLYMYRRIKFDAPYLFK